MIFNATQIIADAFEEKGITFQIEEVGDTSAVNAGYGIPGGPSIMVRFISSDNDSDVAIRVFSLFNSIPKEKELAMHRAISDIHRRVRYVKLYLEPKDMDIHVEYDVPTEVSSEDLGAVCFELFLRVSSILRREYHTLASALYEGGYKPKDDLEGFVEKLKMIRMMRETLENPIVINADDDGESSSDDKVLDLDTSWFEEFFEEEAG